MTMTTNFFLNQDNKVLASCILECFNILMTFHIDKLTDSQIGLNPGETMKYSAELHQNISEVDLMLEVC